MRESIQELILGAWSPRRTGPCGVTADGNNCSVISARAWGLPDRTGYKEFSSSWVFPDHLLLKTISSRMVQITNCLQLDIFKPQMFTCKSWMEICYVARELLIQPVPSHFSLPCGSCVSLNHHMLNLLSSRASNSHIRQQNLRVKLFFTFLNTSH